MIPWKSGVIAEMKASEEAKLRETEGYRREPEEVIEHLQYRLDHWNNVRNFFEVWDIEDAIYYIKSYQMWQKRHQTFLREIVVI